MASQHHHSNNSVDESSHVFYERIHKAIFVLGLELGFLLQGSTVPIQYVATSYVPDTSTQLFLSLVWGYLLATTGLVLFFFCQRLVRTLLHLENSDHEVPDKGNKEDHDTVHYLVDLQCYFAQGSVLGVFLSWMFVDRLLNYQTRVMYGGIMFLASLLYFLRQIWNSHGCMEWVENQLELTISSSSTESESELEPQESLSNNQLLHLL